MDFKERKRLKALEDGRIRRWQWAYLLVVVGVAVAACGFTYVVGRVGHYAMALGVMAVGGVGMVVVGAVLGWKNRPGHAADLLAEAQGDHRDRVQNGRVRQLLAFPALMLVFLGQAFGAVEAVAKGQAEFHHYLQILVPVLYGWLIPMIVMGWTGQGRQQRKYLEDELTASMRARSMILAFVVLMAGGTLALGLGLWRPVLGVIAMPFVLAAGGATAGLRFVWLDRKAGGDA